MLTTLTHSDFSLRNLSSPGIFDAPPRNHLVTADLSFGRLSVAAAAADLRAKTRRTNSSTLRSLERPLPRGRHFELEAEGSPATAAIAQSCAPDGNLARKISSLAHVITSMDYERASASSREIFRGARGNVEQQSGRRRADAPTGCADEQIKSKCRNNNYLAGSNERMLSAPAPPQVYSFVSLDWRAKSAGPLAYA